MVQHICVFLSKVDRTSFSLTTGASRPSPTPHIAHQKKMVAKLGGGHELSSIVNNSKLELFGTRQPEPREPQERREPAKWWQEVRLGAPVHTRQGPG